MRDGVGECLELLVQHFDLGVAAAGLGRKFRYFPLEVREHVGRGFRSRHRKSELSSEAMEFRLRDARRGIFSARRMRVGYARIPGDHDEGNLRKAVTRGQ